VGRLFLARAPESVHLPPEPFRTFTAATPRSRAELEPAVDVARARGLAENRGEWIPGLWVLAVPVVTGGRMRAALAAAAPEARMVALGPERVAARLRRAAVRIETRLAAGAERAA
jgi:DNA-binding IclR family transcriptional regulator